MIELANLPLILSMLSRIQNISFFPILLFQEEELIFPNQASNETPHPLLYDNNLKDFVSTHSGILYDPDFSDIYYAVRKEENFLCVIGPLCLESIEKKQQKQYFHLHGINQTKDLYILHAAPSQAMDALLLTFFLLDGQTGGDFDTPLLSWNQQVSASAESHFHLEQYILENAEKDIPHVPYELESRVLHAFTTSDKKEFDILFQQMSAYSGGEFAASSLKFREYSIISLVTILTRAAIQSGVSPHDAYSLSDILLFKTSQCHNENAYTKIYQETLESFFALIKRQKSFLEEPVYVKKCKLYINHHLNQELSPDILAEHLGISKNYLLSLFSNNEEMSLMQYIHHARIEAAANMLKYSNYDIIDIAAYFHFRTQSHFGVVFKKYMGISPAAFRKNNKLADF